MRLCLGQSIWPCHISCCCATTFIYEYSCINKSILICPVIWCSDKVCNASYQRICHCTRSILKLRRNNRLWTYQLSTFPLFLVHNCPLAGNLVKQGDAFISTRSKACVISTNYVQICHRHKSTAVHGLTFLFVTSKHCLSVYCLVWRTNVFPLAEEQST